jgi:hypothetical protein
MHADDREGNGKGDVILFEPSTSEHVSTRTIFDPITALAPASDCRTYAIGYVKDLQLDEEGVKDEGLLEMYIVVD